MEVVVESAMREKLYHPAFGEVIHAEETLLPDDPDGQVGATIALMRRYAVEDAPYISADRDEALSREPIGAELGRPLTQTEIAERLWRYVHGRIRFVGDDVLSGPLGKDNLASPIVEVLVRPRDMSRMCASGSCQRVGDCDDFSMYLASLLHGAGIKASFVTIAADRADPERFSHVYVAAYPDDGERIALDASHGSAPGWEHDQRYRIEEWPLSMDASQWVVMGLLAGLAYRYARG